MNAVRDAAKEIAKLYNESKTYPEQAFCLKFDFLELEIRAPNTFPPLIANAIYKLRKKKRSAQSFTEWQNILRSCPAIGLIYLHPDYRRKGFFKYLVSELLQLENVQFVCVNNVNSDVLTHYLQRNANWRYTFPMLDNSQLKRLTSYCQQKPAAKQSVLDVFNDYIDTHGIYTDSAAYEKQMFISMLKDETTDSNNTHSTNQYENNDSGISNQKLHFLTVMNNYYTDADPF
ncbi:N-acetyltransferase [Vibrio splendidus]|uniref:Uncharacterized protein n=1 Tax=Vibrio splendidus 12E03 TaxID=1191305 RepID=A0A1E5FRR1_VIBSP|nr:N-acetyltransferase [Vibrio splendidus]OEF93141.1 hypothetical protein A142_00730 [Vibrio splendidus 12E03]